MDDRKVFATWITSIHIFRRFRITHGLVNALLQLRFGTVSVSQRSVQVCRLLPAAAIARAIGRYLANAGPYCAAAAHSEQAG